MSFPSFTREGHICPFSPVRVKPQYKTDKLFGKFHVPNFLNCGFDFVKKKRKKKKKKLNHDYLVFSLAELVWSFNIKNTEQSDTMKIKLKC